MHKSGRLIYSQEERDYITKHYKAKTYKEIAAVLGRSKDAIAVQVYQMGLSKNKPRVKPIVRPRKAKGIKTMKLKLTITGDKAKVYTMARMAKSRGLKLSYK